jgi:hypothetical protein
MTDETVRWTVSHGERREPGREAKAGFPLTRE